MAYSWQQNKNRQTGSGKYSWQTGGLQPTLEEKVTTEKAELSKQGLPVSVSKTKSTPTAVGGFIRSAIMPVADVASNLLGGTNLSNKYLGEVKGLGKIDITKSPLNKENLQTLKRSALTGLELGSYATGGSAVIGAGKNVAKQTAKEFLKTGGKQLAKEGAITGGLGSVGYQGREGKINPLQVIRDTAIGTVAAPLLGVGINKLFGKGTSKVVDEVIPTQKIAKVLPEEEVSKLPPLDKQDYQTHLKTKLENLPEPKADEQTVIFGGDGKNGQYVDTDIKIALNRGVNENTNVMNVKKSELGLPSADRAERGERILNKQEVPIEQAIPEQVKPRVEIPEQVVAKDTQTMANQIEGFDEGTFKQWSSDIRNLDIEEVKRVAMGGEKTTQNTIPKNAYLSVAKNIANETKDIKLAQELATSNVSSKGGQELVASKLAVSDNIVDDLVEIKKSILKRKGMSVDKLASEEQALLTKIKSKIKEMTDTIPTKQEFDNIINSLVCK